MGAKLLALGEFQQLEVCFGGESLIGTGIIVYCEKYLETVVLF